ncbi:transcriptional regulator [Bacillus cereus]|uniref:ArsR/SmtB family transcription factor n=1 Tax=Bacillus cereus group TaxID=86661 RepID=UPI000BEC04FF|nr:MULTISPECIES: winged helix-turn-helix domain-containing protein [Bacillus cereus group]PEA97603.1 transcriptional regulator [Bacillus cereus]PED35113.1 transcriptional regulator [Bacillus cereus]PEF48878.1 transcriptional regulator [Bacillus thuringiensis]PEG05238.1 transcriptional regulator [Bacillus cereus]PER05889.1 transcriptional regulator [Bacillus cereus]
MKQKAISIIETYEQLKVISDPLRTKMLIYLVEKPYTGHQLAQLLNFSRAKILYHLRELEKHNIIQLVKKEEQGGNILKYYQAVSRGFIPANHLLHYIESQQATRQSFLEVLHRAQTRILTAPDTSFDLTSSHIEDWPCISMQTEFSLTEEQFMKFLNQYRNLVKETLEASTLTDTNKNFYVAITGFEIDQLLFNEDL